ncbi:terminase TerL endonuclease subunit [Alkalihalobacillus sp. LMS39]|uniref:terminase TerL endonuclease subunit n=1 Tax=Alkalihalobacillus sp. LMS39 TaxID=2924032 RepID=UPI001FB4007F|nr:terminase TerL endonuclease subunit [Alkalihalobacillus sp. LMS39]UOE96067.1 terminase large subunit [Alkalihalobacillus sp. LMS39]
MPKMYKYHPYIDEYMYMVESGKIQACKEQKLLMDFLRWKLDQPEVVIDAEAIEKSVEVPADYFPFELFVWQKFCNAFIFGVRYKDGRLMFNRFLIEIGRGAGKNGYISYNSFFMLTGHHGIQNYDIDIVATSEKQAKTSFEDVYNVLDDPKHSKKMKKVFYKSKVLIQHKKTKSKMEYNTSNARTKDGKRSGVIIFDEIHEYDNYGDVKVFTSGLGKKPDPRTFYITTDGYIRGGVLDDLKAEAKMVLNKELPESTLFPFICKLDDEKEVDNIDMWEKANPSYRYNKHLQTEMKLEYHDMQLNSALRTEFMTKRMNLPVEDARKEVATYEERLATEKPFPEELKGIEAIGAVDFAQIRDFCSVGLLFKFDGKRYWMQHTFMHHTAPKLQDINQEIIALAIEKKLLTVVYDESINSGHVLNWFVEQAKTFRILKVSMDLYRSTILKEAFTTAGFDVEIVRRGAATHAMLSPLVEEMFVQRTVVFGDDPLMRWYVGNVYKEEHHNGNVEYKKIDKEKRKTDGFFAFLHALNFDSDLKEQTAITKDNVKKIFKSYNY